MSLETPVAFFVFNRPEHTARVFAEIARARPRTLLVVADGPRPDRPGEAERCAEVRSIVGQVDWDCTVLRDYSDTNLGCKRRVSSGLDWVFSHCEQAIILEDDCLPHPTFFRFCEEMLERYAGEERVMHVSGNDFYGQSHSAGFSYRFSGYNFIWGWATWRRAWQRYDVSISSWPALRETNWLREVTGSRGSARYWRDVFDRVHRGEVDTWDYQWMFASWKSGGLAVTPTSNLVTNIGFDEDATHTTVRSRVADLPSRAMKFSLRHPPELVRDREADRIVSHRVFEWVLPSRPRRLYQNMRSCLSASIPPRIRRTVRKVLRVLAAVALR